ncbi:MAG TPA: thioredoxin family protein [Tepidisphaeraceae bacterium]
MRKILFPMALIAIVSLSLLAKNEPAAGGNKAALGQAAPDFSLTNQEGKEIKLSELQGKLVVLEWLNPACPYVQRHYKAKTMATLADKYAEQGVVWLAINSTGHYSADAMKSFIDDHKLSYSILNDVKTDVAKAYGATTTPDMFVIDKDGKLAYMGAIDNDPDGKATERTNYVDQALQELLASKSVSTPETKSYGCHVKWAD